MKSINQKSKKVECDYRAMTREELNMAGFPKPVKMF
jgi:hypothetical protein